MAILNKVLLIGRAANEPELRYTTNGKALCRFALAVPTTFQQDSDVEYYDITVWGSPAEMCAEYLKKGRLIFIEGRLRKSSWEKEGQKHYRCEVVARTVQFLDRPRKPAEPETDGHADSEAPEEPVEEPAA